MHVGFFILKDVSRDNIYTARCCWINVERGNVDSELVNKIYLRRIQPFWSPLWGFFFQAFSAWYILHNCSQALKPSTCYI